MGVIGLGPSCVLFKPSGEAMAPSGFKTRGLTFMAAVLGNTHAAWDAGRVVVAWSCCCEGGVLSPLGPHGHTT